MRREEARELQRRVLERGLHRVAGPEFSPRGRADSGRPQALPERGVAELAVGIRGAADDFSLAVRAPRDGEDVRAAVERIRAEAPVDFEVVGRIRALSEPWHRSKVRPLWPGSSAAHRRVNLGTLGCFVTLRDDPLRRPHILSNNHVFAREREDLLPRPDDRIFQPARADDVDPDDDTVAQLARWVPLAADDNLVDAAVARLEEGIAFQPTVLDALGDLQGVRPADEPLAADEVVYKVGRSTGTRSGRVGAQHLQPLPVEFPTGRRSFVEVIEIESADEPFCDFGDSGSLVVDEALRAVALLFAKADQAGTAYANPIGHVLDLLAVDLLLHAPV